VEVLKVAHHGSQDAGLDGLLDRSAPQLAVISVGPENPYGHPTAATIATLAEHEVPTLRTDERGEVTITVEPGGWRAETED
jgi:competence protein ComEC